MKLIDADKLREQISALRPHPATKESAYAALAQCVTLIDAAPDLSLTWEEVRRLVRTADSIITRETGKYRDEQAYYEEVLRRFNATQE